MRKLNAEDLLDFIGLADIFDLDKVKEELLKSKFTNMEAAGKKAFLLTLKQFASPESKDRLFDFLSKPLEMSANEVRTMPLIELVKCLNEVASFKEWKDFFHQC